jgi:hypothetical protein
MAEDPKTVLIKAREALIFAVKICFYYPACGLDFLYPLQHFSDRCDTFVFCDWKVGDKQLFLDQINTIKAGRPEGIADVAPDFFDSLLQQADVEKLANMEDILARFFQAMPPNLRRFLADPSSQEKHYAELWITDSGGEKKFVRVFWFAMEGVNIYWKLFAQHGIAPRILCIKNWGRHDDNDNDKKWWTPFGEWQAHLGQVVQDSHSEPEFLVARKGDHNWPWTVPVAEFNDWGEQQVVMWEREKPASPGRRRVCGAAKSVCPKPSGPGRRTPSS